jgi:hypothetical protein
VFTPNPSWKPVCWMFLTCILAVGAVRSADPTPPGKDDWKYDVVYRKKDKPFYGLILEEKPAHVKLLRIIRKPGTPTVVMEEMVTRPEIDRVERLDDTDREELEQRVKALRRDREVLAAQLKLLDPAVKGKGTIERVNLQTADWPADPKAKALQYQSTHFKLVSNAKEEVVQLAAIQLEQVYAAYARALPPRDAAVQPTTILLTGSIEDYKALTRDQGANLVNPAFYDDAKNQIFCGSDLQRLRGELERLHDRHAALYAELNDREKELKQVYKGAIPNEIAGPIDEARKKIQTANIQNRDAFDMAQRRLFQPLYHEAFHAYVATAVYARAEGELPRWLNEGLAQIFETAVFEAGELRVGHADKARLIAVRQALKKKELLGLADLLRSGPKQFQVAHATEKQVSDQHYLASWALGFYLTFDRKLLGTKALDDYVRALQRGTDPLEAFQDLVGAPLPQFEKDFRQYLSQLQSDGSVNK